MAGLVIAGYDEKRGGQVYSIPLGGTLTKQPIATSGSGSGYISGLIDDKWKEGMTKAEALDFVRLCIAHAMALDGSSGGVIRTLCVEAGGLEEACVPGNKLPFGP
mmetsp:Transcript_124524/g.194442  ORF Transcript_124524/g.194442 Transcript_124524/m.194442 type:complete len:105 (+) Transcript_124524:667-981(+)